MLKLYQNIKNLRKENGWTQEDLANKMGYDRSSIAKIESGKVDLPQSKIMEFAKVFRVEAGDLMGLPEENHLDIQIDIDDPDRAAMIERAVMLYKQYELLPPDKKTAFENYLKFLQSGS